MREIWKKILNGYYEVSNLGRVRRAKSGRGPTYVGKILKLGVSEKGYSTFASYVEGVRKDQKVHQIVASAFLGPRPLGKEVNHKDGVKSNCRDTNLEYVTSKQNKEHAVKLGLWNPVVGRRHWNVKMTERKVRRIRQLYETGKYSLKELAQKFDSKNVWEIVTRKVWKQVG